MAETEKWTTIGCQNRTAQRFNKARGKMNQDEFLTWLMDEAKVKPLEEMSAFVDEPKKGERK